MDKNSGFTNVYSVLTEKHRKINFSIDSTLKFGEAYKGITYNSVPRKF